MKKIRIYKNDVLVSETDHTPRQEQVVKIDVEMAKQNKENLRYEVYTPPPVYTVGEAKRKRKADVNSESFRRVASIHPEYQQRNAALGIYDSEKTTAITKMIASHRDAVISAESEIDALEDVEAILYYEVNWP